MRFCLVLLPKNLFNRFQILLTAIFPENADEKEIMVSGRKIDTKEDKDQKASRNFVTFTIRSLGEVGAIRICGAILIDFLLLLVNSSYEK